MYVYIYIYIISYHITAYHPVVRRREGREGGTAGVPVCVVVLVVCGVVFLCVGDIVL